MGAHRGNNGQRVSLKMVLWERENIFGTPEKPHRLVAGLAGLGLVDKDNS